VTFVSTSYDPDGMIVSWAWDFGDGTTGSGETVTHVYKAEGTYIVTLKVTDNDGLTATTSATIMVSPPPPPPAEVYKADLTGRSAWPEHHHYVVSKDEDAYNTLFAKVTNLGTAQVEVKVVFEIKDARDGTIIGSLEVTATLAVGETKDLTVQFYPPEFGWTAGTKAKYYVNATCYYYDLNTGSWVQGKTKTFSFAVVP
jgi:PKD repeat protein